jgi:hypothetical protein
LPRAKPSYRFMEMEASFARRGPAGGATKSLGKSLRDFPRLLAERMGFEPMVRCDPYTGLANRRFRPLSHLSVSLTVGILPLESRHRATPTVARPLVAVSDGRFIKVYDFFQPPQG